MGTLRTREIRIYPRKPKPRPQQPPLSPNAYRAQVLKQPWLQSVLNQVAQQSAQSTANKIAAIRPVQVPAHDAKPATVYTFDGGTGQLVGVKKRL